MLDLPEGWTNCRLPDLAQLIMGQSPPSNTYNTSKKAEFGKIYPSPVKYCSNPVKIAEPDDILISVRAPVGPTNLCRERSCIGRGLAAIRARNGVEGRYLFYFLRSIEQWLATQGTGSTFTAVSKADLEDIEVPVPPLDEQRRIVAKLEELLGKVEVCQNRLAKIPVILKRFRQSVLATACSGRLTVDWRSQRGNLPCEEKTVGELIVEKPKNGYSAKPVKYRTPFRVLTLTATTSGKFNSEHFKYFHGPIQPDSDLWLRPNHILVQRGNTIQYVGVPAIYDGKPKQFIYPDLMMRLRAGSAVIPKFLYFALSCERSRNYLRKKATGTAGSMPKINQQTLTSVPIELPPLAEQQEIVRRLEALFKIADQIRQTNPTAPVF